MKAPHILVILAFAMGCGDEVTQDDSSTSGSGGDTSTMGATAACQTCVENLYGSDAQCQANIQTCDGDPACDAWKNCSEGCFNENDAVACYAGCESDFPHDTTLSAPLIACTCDSCSDVCVATCT